MEFFHLKEEAKHHQIHQDVHQGLHQDVHQGLHQGVHQGVHQSVHQGVYQDVHQGVHELPQRRSQAQQDCLEPPLVQLRRCFPVRPDWHI